MSVANKIRHFGVRCGLVLGLALSVLIAGAGPAFASADSSAGAVYVLTNDAAANGVAVFTRADDGTLAPAGTFPTGGQGSGAGLGSQGALALSRNNQWLFAVNAGSNDISSFAVTDSGLSFVSRIASGGLHPISITNFGNLVYVLNDGGSGNIAGFTVAANGALSSIANSARSLSSSAAGPAEVEFSRSGEVLAVTEKNTSKIDVYPVGKDGRASNAMTSASNGATPFGFDFGLRDTLVVSEAPGSAASSYAVSPQGALRSTSASVPDFQAAACWLVVTPNGRLAFAANAHNDTVSSYRIAPDGSLTLANSLAASLPAGSAPLDLGLSANGQYLYQLAGAGHTITGFRIGSDGSLAQIGSPLPLPASAIGVAAR